MKEITAESSSSVVPPEVFQNIESLNEQVDSLKRELAQAQEVWQGTLAEEKRKYEELLEHKELASREQEKQWARQTQAYEERLSEMATEFEARLAQNDQNAARALAELDDAWQHDKLGWGPGSQADWPAQRRELEVKAQALEEKLARLEGVIAVPAAAQAGPTPETVKALQDQLIEFQQTVAALQDRASRSDDLVNACVKALDYQISVLYDLVQHYTTPSTGEGAGLARS